MKTLQDFNKFEHYLDAFSKVYWLRPITAIWRSIEATFFDLEHLKSLNLRQDWVDLGVGDGLFSTLAAGLDVPKNFDAYLYLRKPKELYRDINGQSDFFDMPPNYKFDYRVNFRGLPNKYRPSTPWALGIDHKPNLLLKAKKLGTFRELKELSLDNASGLFLEHERFDLCFSNSIYWSRNPKAILVSLRKHLKSSEKPNLLLSLQLKNYEKIRSKILDNLGSMKPYFDNGRKDHPKSVYEIDDWIKIIENSGYQVIETFFMANKNLVSSMEWLDNRQLYTYFAAIRNRLKSRDQKSIKQDVSDYIKALGIEAFKSGVYNSNQKTGTYLLIKAIKTW